MKTWKEYLTEAKLETPNDDFEKVFKKYFKDVYFSTNSGTTKYQLRSPLKKSKSFDGSDIVIEKDRSGKYNFVSDEYEEWNTKTPKDLEKSLKAILG